MNITLPAHSDPCHAVVVYDGSRYVEEHLIDRKQCGDELCVDAYLGFAEARFEHSPSNVRGDKVGYEYRAVARLDGIWHAYDITSPTLGLPELVKCCGKEEACSAPADTVEVTDPCPVDRVKEAASQDDAQPKAVNADESLTPATNAKSRTRR